MRSKLFGIAFFFLMSPTIFASIYQNHPEYSANRYWLDDPQAGKYGIPARFLSKTSNPVKKWLYLDDGEEAFRASWLEWGNLENAARGLRFTEENRSDWEQVSKMFPPAMLLAFYESMWASHEGQECLQKLDEFEKKMDHSLWEISERRRKAAELAELDRIDSEARERSDREFIAGGGTIVKGIGYTRYKSADKVQTQEEIDSFNAHWESQGCAQQ